MPLTYAKPERIWLNTRPSLSIDGIVAKPGVVDRILVTLVYEA